MGLAQVTDPEAVLSAIAEFDERGRHAFHKEYGFRLDYAHQTLTAD